MYNPFSIFALCNEMSKNELRFEGAQLLLKRLADTGQGSEGGAIMICGFSIDGGCG